MDYPIQNATVNMCHWMMWCMVHHICCSALYFLFHKFYNKQIDYLSIRLPKKEANHRLEKHPKVTAKIITLYKLYYTTCKVTCTKALSYEDIFVHAQLYRGILKCQISKTKISKYTELFIIIFICAYVYTNIQQK